MVTLQQKQPEKKNRNGILTRVFYLDDGEEKLVTDVIAVGWYFYTTCCVPGNVFSVKKIYQLMFVVIVFDFKFVSFVKIKLCHRRRCLFNKNKKNRTKKKNSLEMVL